MDLINAVRNHPQFPIQWPTLYGEDDFIGQGTILDVSLMGGRLAGTMPNYVTIKQYVDSPLPGNAAGIVPRYAQDRETAGTQGLRKEGDDDTGSSTH